MQGEAHTRQKKACTSVRPAHSDTGVVAFRDRRGGERRRQATRFHLPERRTGFDRRANWNTTGPARTYRRALEYLKERPDVLAVVLVFVNLLNALDLLFTLNVLKLGGTEANPIMNFLFENGTATAAAFKLAIVGLISLAIWRLRRYRRALEAGIIGLFLLGTVVAYHVYGALFLI